MYQSTLEELLHILNIPWREFQDFIMGQTVQSDEGNGVFYYWHDIKAFLTRKMEGYLGGYMLETPDGKKFDCRWKGNTTLGKLSIACALATVVEEVVLEEDMNLIGPLIIQEGNTELSITIVK